MDGKARRQLGVMAACSKHRAMYDTLHSVKYTCLYEICVSVTMIYLYMCVSVLLSVIKCMAPL